TVEFGSNAYGIKSAAHTFFNKKPHQLNVQEAALLVGLVKGPTLYSPRRNPENALARRNLVLDRMATSGAISRRERDSLAELPIRLDFRPVSHNDGSATYFREMLRLAMNAKRPVRRQFANEWDYEQAVKEYDENPIYGWCLKNTKADGTPYDIYRDGLKIYTTIDSRLQTYAEQAVQQQMQQEIQPQMDAQYRRTKTLFLDTPPKERERIVNNAIRTSDRYREMKRAGVGEKEILASFERPCPMKVFTYRGERDTLLTPRDSILHHKRIMRASLVAMDPRTGHVKAYVGGPNFRYFKYDMAKQGKRQIGSTIKPFVYTFAIDHLGLSPNTPVPNLPVTIETGNGVPWSPKEAGRVEQNGELHPLSWGLARSRNNYSAWIMKQAKQPQAVASFIHNMGIRSYIDP
ncbi:MAG: transglycosylase domain-containing protein, partial [Alistipes sp.]|nr:transglycosylase domain-containing protein [Alistipes sp.]